MPRSTLRTLSLLLMLGLAHAAHATVTCTVSAPTLAFGTYPIVSSDTASSTVTVTCTRGTNGDKAYAYDIQMSVGGGTFAQRTLTGGGQTLSYNIYQDLGNTQIWGDGTGGSTIFSGTYDFTPVTIGVPTVIATIPVYATIPAHSLTVNNDQLPNTYLSNITLTIRRTAPNPPTNLTPTGTMAVSATINPGCSIVSNATLGFGNYDPAAVGATDAATTISFRCTLSSIYDIGFGGTVGARTMSGPGGDTLGYELYQDSGRTTTWGNAQDTSTIAADDAADTTGNGLSTLNAAHARTVYGRIPAGQDVNAGSYSSTVTITIYY